VKYAEWDFLCIPGCQALYGPSNDPLVFSSGSPSLTASRFGTKRRHSYQCYALSIRVRIEAVGSVDAMERLLSGNP
jgi:hypothetical protein